MGKHNFQKIYRDALEQLGERPTIKLSSYCDRYNPTSKYAGMIIYHAYGAYKWQQQPGQGLAGGYRGRSFYVLILCTDTWPENALKAAGQGRVHDYLYQQYFDMDHRSKQSCCAGFAILRGKRVYSSVYLNCQSGSVNGLEWSSDGNKLVSPPEQELIDCALSAWEVRGSGAVVRVPEDLHLRICLQVQFTMATGDCSTDTESEHLSR